MRHPHRDRARELRRNQTEAELRLWGILRGRRIANAKFRRQVPIGPYIADFVCREVGLIIEADGGQHSDQVAYDTRRTAWLEAQGYDVLRCWNMDILEETDGVIERIASEVQALRQSKS